MTSGRGSEQGTGAILRALGSLIAALGDGTETRSVRLDDVSRAASALDTVAVDASVGDGSVDEAATLLADARQRAQRLLDESMERANSLLTRSRRDVVEPEGGSESLRRSMQELIHTVHDVQDRLDRIETLLNDRFGVTPRDEGGRTAPRVAPSPRQAVPPPAPADLPSSAVPPVRASAPSGYMPPPAQTRQPAPARPAPPPPPPPPAPEPPIVRATPPRETPIDVPPREAPPRIEAAPAAPAPSAPRNGAGPLATFTPADGAVMLRATPIAGFQGLMRVQDALARLVSVRQATVEAYAQGEARLRVELSADVDSDQIAAALAEAVGQPAHVREADEGDRTMLVVFG